jgi:hypothetical protein
MTGSGMHGSHNALIGQWPASAGHSHAWWLHRHRVPRFAGPRWGTRSGGSAMGGATWLVRARCVAMRTSTASLKSP